MAKRSLFWGQASGKLGETVLYRAGGEQRTRTYVAKIKNPKTLAQVENRLSMLNFSTIYRNLKPILSNSFPNRPTAQSGFNAFVKANKSVNSPVIGKEDAQKGLCAPINMLMSEGYLTQFGLSVAETNERGNVIGQNVNFDLDDVMTDMASNVPVAITKETDIATVFDGLELPTNARITLIHAVYKDNGYVLKYSQFRKDMSELELTTQAVPLALYKNTTNKTNVIGAYITANEDLACCVISYTDANGKLQVSTSRMIGIAASAEYTAQFLKGGDIWQAVLANYGYNEGSVLG